MPRDILIYAFGCSMAFAGFLVPKYILNEKPEPVPTEATELMINTFSDVSEKLTVELARCMSLVQICERMRHTFDAQLDAIFQVNKENLCGKK